MSPSNEPDRTTRQPAPAPRDSGPLFLVVALIAAFFIATYLAPRLSKTASNDAVGANHATLADAEAAEKAGNQKQAHNILLSLAKKDNAQAQLKLAEMYEIGPPDGSPDLKQAATWYEKASRAGLVAAKARLGHLYLEGVGVLQDFAKAKPLLEEAANDGNATAQFDLGRMWQHGWGGEENERLAYAWFELAAQQDYAPALKARDKLLAGLSPVQVKEAQDLLEKLNGNVFKPSGKD